MVLSFLTAVALGGNLTLLVGKEHIEWNGKRVELAALPKIVEADARPLRRRMTRANEMVRAVLSFEPPGRMDIGGYMRRWGEVGAMLLDVENSGVDRVDLDTSDCRLLGPGSTSAHLPKSQDRAIANAIKPHLKSRWPIHPTVFVVRDGYLVFTAPTRLLPPESRRSRLTVRRHKWFRLEWILRSLREQFPNEPEVVVMGEPELFTWELRSAVCAAARAGFPRQRLRPGLFR